MEGSSQFKDAGTKPGLEVWILENLLPVKIQDGEHGKMYEGNCYLVLHTATPQASLLLSWSVHIWIGKDAGAEEKEAAIRNAGELEDLLEGASTQTRECQGHESPLFCSLFKGGLRTVPGRFGGSVDDIDGGETFFPKFYQVKGKRNVRVQRLAEVSVHCMNKGDCFILCTPNKIWIYIGKYSKSCERYKALHAASNIREQDYENTTNEVKIEQVKPNSPQEIVDNFFSALGGGSRLEMADPPEEDDDDDPVISQKKDSVSLYRVSDSSGAIEVTKIGENNLSAAMLHSSDCFILDPSGVSEIFVWIGTSCTQTEKVEAFAHAEKFLGSKGYPTWTKIQRVVDGGEPPEFKSFFRSWRENSLPVVAPIYAPESTAGASDVEKKPQLVSQEKHAKLVKNLGTCVGFCPDDGSGKVELWRIEDFQLVPVPGPMIGIFFTGDSYVLQYTYVEYGEEKYIIYYWQGNQSTQDEIGASALQAVKLDEKLRLRAILVRVLQAQEPAHFLRIFKGKMVTFLGGHPSAFRKIKEPEVCDTSKARLFHIKGTCEDDTRAEQVPLSTTSLDSDDVFVLDAQDTGGHSYIWIGCNASEKEKETAEKIGKVVSPDRDEIKVNEGEEPDEFWELMGGRGPYRKMSADGIAVPPVIGARLFHCSIPEGKTILCVEEVFNFQQEDLHEDDVMVLDSGADEVFVWVGKGATPQERMYSSRMADDYIANNYMRCGGVCVTVSIVLKQHHEPQRFKLLFPKWDNGYWKM